ncbi:15-hydroxyprostaglandin dehydrogenase [Trichonephila clavipes]|nr:15-hydroxyprostaglandin dehydrogenase [Trichonephila clavipes]
MASAVLADPTRALQGTNRGSGPAMEESENYVGSLEQLLLYADERYLEGKVPLGDHLEKVLHGVEEYHQRNVGLLRFHASQSELAIIGYGIPDHYTSCAGSVT